MENLQTVKIKDPFLNHFFQHSIYEGKQNGLDRRIEERVGVLFRLIPYLLNSAQTVFAIPWTLLKQCAAADVNPIFNHLKIEPISKVIEPIVMYISNSALFSPTTNAVWKVNYCVLLNKISPYKIKQIDWFEEFTSNPRHFHLEFIIVARNKFAHPTAISAICMSKSSGSPDKPNNNLLPHRFSFFFLLCLARQELIAYVIARKKHCWLYVRLFSTVWIQTMNTATALLQKK